MPRSPRPVHAPRSAHAGASRCGKALAIALALGAILSFSGGSVAAAQVDAGCGDGPDLLSQRPERVLPGNGAPNVATNAPVRADYPAGYFGPTGPGGDPASLISLGLCPTEDGETGCGRPCAVDDAEPVSGVAERVGDTLFFTPDEAMLPSRRYAARASGIDGSVDSSFCTGRREDTGAPILGPFVAAGPAPADATCELPSGGRRIGLRWGQASDDGALGSIEYLLYLTRGPGVGAPQVRDRLFNVGSDELIFRLLLSPTESTVPVCVRLVAIDGVGNVSEPSEEQCVDPLTDVEFQPLCAVSAPGARGSALGALSLGLIGAVIFVARRRR